MDLDSRRLVAGRYRLVARLGVGGMGTVWRAEDEVLGREVAVKEVVFPHGLSDEDREVLRERTRREARAAARLDHPSAVTIYDVVEEDGSPCLVMELVEARTLSEVVRGDGPLTPQRTAQVGLALLGALEAAHRQGVVHRDVKPGNVLLCPGEDGRVVLTDFGIASSVGDSSITTTGLLLGSPSYIAPERARGQAPGPASDLWSLGATLFTAVEGRPPYDGGDPMTTVTAVVTGEHEPYVAAGALEPVLEGLLEREPERRMTVAQARAALSALAAQARVVAAPEPSPEAELRTEQTTAMDVRDVREAAGAAATAHPSGEDTRAVPLMKPDPPRRDRPGRRDSRALPAAAAAVLLGLAAVAGVALGGGLPGSGDRPGDAPPGASAAPTDGPASGPAALPEGWTAYTDDAGGWSIGVPPGYTQSTRRGQVQFRNEQTRRTLRIGVGPATGDAQAAARGLAGALQAQLADYTELGMTPVEGQDAADLEFTYVDQTRLHVVNRTVVDPAAGRAYTLYWQTRDTDFADARQVFEQLRATFRLPD